MSLPNTLNSLPVGAGIELQMAISRGALTPPSQNFVGPLVAACIAAGCAIGAACEAIGTTIVCVCAVGAICYTASQLQRLYEQLKADYDKKSKECDKLPSGSQAQKDCNSLLHQLYREMMKAFWRWRQALGDGPGLGNTDHYYRGSSTSNPGGSGLNKPQM